jgi:hypothetical protein
MVQALEKVGSQAHALQPLADSSQMLGPTRALRVAVRTDHRECPRMGCVGCFPWRWVILKRDHPSPAGEAAMYEKKKGALKSLPSADTYIWAEFSPGAGQATGFQEGKTHYRAFSNAACPRSAAMARLGSYSADPRRSSSRVSISADSRSRSSWRARSM